MAWVFENNFTKDSKHAKIILNYLIPIATSDILLGRMAVIIILIIINRYHEKLTEEIKEHLSELHKQLSLPEDDKNVKQKLTFDLIRCVIGLGLDPLNKFINAKLTKKSGKEKQLVQYLNDEK
jgi:hypothetical protein